MQTIKKYCINIKKSIYLLQHTCNIDYSRLRNCLKSKFYFQTKQLFFQKAILNYLFLFVTSLLSPININISLFIDNTDSLLPSNTISYIDKTHCSIYIFLSIHPLLQPFSF